MSADEHEERTCPDCQGLGAWLGWNICRRCGGEGVIPA